MKYLLTAISSINLAIASGDSIPGMLKLKATMSRRRINTKRDMENRLLKEDQVEMCGEENKVANEQHYLIECQLNRRTNMGHVSVVQSVRSDRSSMTLAAAQVYQAEHQSFADELTAFLCL